MPIMKFPMTVYTKAGVEATIANKEAYDALTLAQVKDYGLIHHPKMVYETVEDTIVDEASGKKEITYHVTNEDGERVPVGTLFNGREEAHYDFSCVKVN